MKRTNTAKWIESAKRWQINVQKDGVRKTFTSAKPGRTGQREANKKADVWLEKGVGTSRSNVDGAWNQFLDQKKLVSEEEYTKMESFGRVHLLPQIGKKTVNAMSEQDFQLLINYAFKHPQGRKNTTLSKKTLQNYVNYCKQFVKFCRKSKLTTLELDEIEIPTAARYKGKSVLTVENLQTLIKTDTTVLDGKTVRDEYINYYRFQVFTGVRPGEMRGLKWEDVHGNTCELHQAINTKGQRTHGKNENALRTVVLSQYAIATLNDQRQYTGNQEYVFPMASMHTYYHRWQRYQRVNGMPELSLYEMRHTFVSIAKELPQGDLKQLIGHSKSMDTYKQYSHYLEGDDERTADNLQAVFDRLTNQKSTH